MAYSASAIYIHLSTSWGHKPIRCYFSISEKRSPIGNIMLPVRETISYVGTTKLTIFDCVEKNAFVHVLAAIIGILVEK